ncbi:hypothetical protein ACPCHT_02425 [Nucisporomicrobium flavum]|uniref:hypothetical protein n=1 Tax=Nucisporomicrobium flavum TaxID=2785915 RepID=UPI003C2C8904
MAFADELEVKVGTIERLALEWYEQWMRQFGFTWDGHGSVMLDPQRPQPPAQGVNQPLSVEEQTRPMQENFRLFNEQLQELLLKFRGYYALEPHSVNELQERIGGSVSDVGNGTNSSVHDRLSLAFDPWLLEVMKLVDSDDWSGPAAGAFQSGFLTPFSRMSEIQKACVRELGLTAYGWNKATEAAEKNLREIADACIYRMGHPSGLSNVAVHVLSITSLVAGGLSFVPPVALPAGVVSLSTAVWTYMDALNKQFEKKFDFYIEGNTPLQAVVSTTEVLKEVDRQLAEFDGDLAKALQEDLTGAEGFEHPSIRLPQAESSGGMGRLDMSSQRMVTSIVRLHRAGSTNLPIIADQYAAAASIIGGCMPPSGVVTFMVQSAAAFDRGVDRLVDVFHNTCDRATVAGEALVQTAKDYDLTDTDRAEAMRQISEQEQQPVWVGDEPERAGGV